MSRISSDRLAAVAQNRNPEYLRLAILDLAYAAKSYREIAEAMGVEKGVVAGIIYRARKAGDTRLPPVSKGGNPAAERARRAEAAAKPAQRRSPAPPKSPARKLECHIPSSSVARKGSYRAFPTAAPAEVAAIAVERQHAREAAMTAETVEWHPIRVPFLETREGLCRWPLWKGDTPFHAKFVCGLPATLGKPYCPRCRALAYAPPRQTKQLDEKLGIATARKVA